MSKPIPNPCRNPLVMINCVVDVTKMARNDANVYMKAPISPTCRNDSFFNTMFDEKPETNTFYLIKKIIIDDIVLSALQHNDLH